jgi:hypothetical protein
MPRFNGSMGSAISAALLYSSRSSLAGAVDLPLFLAALTFAGLATVILVLRDFSVHMMQIPAI